MDLKELRKQGKLLKHILSIGKAGLSEGSIALIEKELKQHKLIKVKLLPTAFEGSDKKTLAENICQKLGAKLIDQVGHVIVLYRR